jgi:hypothetical protein
MTRRLTPKNESLTPQEQEKVNRMTVDTSIKGDSQLGESEQSESFIRKTEWQDNELLLALLASDNATSRKVSGKTYYP